MKQICRFLSGMAAFIALAVSLPVSANKYSDWWWNPNQSGQGLNIGQQGDTIFAAWFTYDNAGESMWVTLVGDVVNDRVTGDLLLFKGPALGTPFNPASVTNTKVGTATLTFTTLYTGRLQWTINGINGDMDVQRFTFKPLAYAGKYYTQCVGGSNCPGGVASYAVSTVTTLSYDGVNLRAIDEINGGKRCTFDARLSEADFLGSQIRAFGTYSCNDGDAGQWNSNISFDRTGTQVVLLRRDVLTPTGRNCTTTQVVTGAVLLR